MTDLDELERLAQAAAPGPWRADDEHGDIPGAEPAWCVSRTDSEGAFLGDVAYGAHSTGADVEFIAAANPQTVLTLIERVKRAEAEVAFLKENRLPGLEADAAALDRAEAVIAEALGVTQSGSVPLGVTEARHYDGLLAEARRILATYQNGADQ